MKKLEQLYKEEEKLFCKLATLAYLSKDEPKRFCKERGEIIKQMGDIRDRIDNLLNNGIETF